jgi:polysaccharide export outer membrane protein
MLHVRRLLSRLCLAALPLLLGACAGGPPTASPSEPAAGTRAETAQPGGRLVPAVVGLPPDGAGASDQRLSAGDVLEIEVFRVPELSSSERIDPTGSITLPLIGSIEVAGLRVADAEARIETILAREYLQDPQVSIFVEEFANMTFTVGGSVKRPGVFELTGDTTLLEAIAQAEGTTDMANPRQVLLFRRRPNAAGDVEAYVIDLRGVMRGELRDPRIASDDKIMVPRSGSSVLFKNVTDTLRGFVRFPFY